MKFSGNRALRLALAITSLLLLALGLLTVRSPVSHRSQTRESVAPAEVEESLIPPHREPTNLPPSTPGSPPAAQPALADQIASALASSGASTQAASVWIEGQGFVIEQSAREELVPASTQKIFVAASALSVLGPAHKLSTRVIRTGDVVDGYLQGDLALVGGGDPSFSKADLENLARAVASSGIRGITGAIIGDESRYDRQRAAPGWKPYFVTHESGTLSALAVDGNSYRNDPEFIAEPALANAQLFRDVLAAAGVQVGGAAVALPPAPPIQNGIVIAAKHSPPLSELVDRMLTESDNFYAELLVKELGLTSGSASTSSGMDVIRRFAAAQRLPMGPSADGSGLSSENRQSASTQMKWLEWIDTHLGGVGFTQMLPSACSGEGTLKKRMCGSSAAGKVFAKSGGLPRVATLSGYATTASGRQVRFAFSLIGSSSGKAARLAIDNALVAITSFTG